MTDSKKTRGLKIEKPEITGDDKLQEKTVKYVVAHKLKVSALSIFLMILSAFLGLPPFSWLTALPEAWGKGFIIVLLAQLIAFYPSRWGYRLLSTVNYDLIFVQNPADQRRVKMYQYAKGHFTDDFEFKNGRPLTWENKRGVTCYSVIELERDEKVAYCSYLGDYSQGEVIAFEEAWKQQRLKNDEERRAGAEIRMKSGQIISQMRAQISNAWIRDLQEIELDQETTEQIDDALPEGFSKDIEVDGDLLDDLEDQASEPKNLEFVTSEGEGGE